MNNSNRTKSLGSEWVKNEIIVHNNNNKCVRDITVSHQSLKPKSLLNLARLLKIFTQLDLTRLLKISLFSNYRVLLCISEVQICFLQNEQGRSSLHSCSRMSETFVLVILFTSHVTWQKIRVGGYTVTDCMNMKLKLGEYILQLHIADRHYRARGQIEKKKKEVFND